MKLLLQQVVRTLILTAGVVGLVLLLKALNVTTAIHDGIWIIIIFSAVVGIGVAMINMYFVRKTDGSNNVAVFLGTTVFRMLLSIIFITLQFFQGLENEVIWIVNFFVVYLFYLVFEIYSIISNLRANSNDGENND
jgi:uncharacterized membrane protein